MKIKGSNRILLIALLICIVSGMVCEYFYSTSPKKAIQTERFEAQLLKKETKADKTLDELKQILIHYSEDSLIYYPFTNNDISYYVFENNELVFWSDNHLDISNITLPDSTDWHYVQLPNAHCVGRMVALESTKMLALITIKNNYPYENDRLINNFARGFDLDKRILIVNGKNTDKNAIFCSHNNYLFSLAEPQTPIFNESWAAIGLFAFSFAFLIFFFLYARAPLFVNKKTINLKIFIGLAVSVGILIGLSLLFNIPSLLFWNKIFTPFQYATNPFLASICHLTIATGYILSTIYLFYFYVEISKLKSPLLGALLQISYLLYFGLVYYVLSGLIYNSSNQLSILNFNDFSVITLWIHFLILIWGIGLALLFIKIHSWFKKKNKLKLAFISDCILSVLLGLAYFFFSPEETLRVSLSYTALWLILYLPFILPKHKNIYRYVAWWVLVFTTFLVWNSMILNRDKKCNKYKILAQNILINGNTENDRMADILLEELEIQINNDQNIAQLVSNTDSLAVANKYLNETYLRGFWSKYDMRLNVAAIHTDLYNEYDKFINEVGTQVKNTHFYSVPASENNMSYIGVFQSKPAGPDSLSFFMVFYPRRHFKSYSFPNLLISSSPDIQTQLDISYAKYEHRTLVYSSGTIEYPANSNWIPKSGSDFFSVIHNNHMQYVYAPNRNTRIVITEQQAEDQTDYLLYFIYTYLAYFSFCWLVVWGFALIQRKGGYRLGLTAKFQYAFMALLILSFLGIFYVSVNFIRKKYQREQIDNLESKKNYIQKALQDMYYWNQDLNAENMAALNFDLQDLSYTYHTDIHVYNNRGVLVGSSQPVIFNKSLISNRISPTPYFTMNANINQYEHIGKLNYLTAYADFYNGDYLQIGYIAVPQFFSQSEIRNEIEGFLAVIIHIYLIIIVLAILLSLVIGKQLSAPLNMLENKLKEMRIGRRNEKIDYRLNDEIGQLVAQYNRTVDELEKSALLLAKSERQSAWKSMARQVAHEINNPLTPMKLTIQQLQRTKKMGDKRFDDYFEKSTVMLIEQIDNLSRIAGTFSNFARMPEAKFNRVDIAARLYSVVQLFTNNYEHVHLNYVGEEKNVFVYADSEQLVQVFNNLLKNAIQAIPSARRGVIQINMNQTDQQVIIQIKDNGTGIAEGDRDKLFVPNFTTKNTGMGLGLAIAKNIIDLSGGTISFTSRQNVGTTFTIILPKA